MRQITLYVITTCCLAALTGCSSPRPEPDGGDADLSDAGLRDADQRQDDGGADDGDPDTIHPDAEIDENDGDPDHDGPIEEDDAVIIASTFPERLACGEARAVTVTVRNVGSATWTRSEDYKLGAVDDSDPLLDGDPRVWLPEEAAILPGDSWTFELTLTAPTSPGLYVTDWQMVHEHLRWFGQVHRREVSVECEGQVDATTLEGKQIFGYQGWFTCPGDGSPVDRWVHWFRGQSAEADQATFDLWPDASELTPEERCETAMTARDGSPAVLYSAWNTTTVVRHFRWMAEHGIDGVMLQRFTSELRDPAFRTLRDGVADNVRAGAEAHGRVFAMMYDISGQDGVSLVTTIQEDWTHLVDDLGLTTSDRYLHHGGRPLVAIWGLGFDDRPGTPAQAAELIEWFHSGAPARLQATVMGGVPTHWRTLSGDSQDDPAWAEVYRSWDVISPWAVGRYGDDAGADRFRRDLIEPDLAAARSAGRDYLPVVFPGFSWHNLNSGDLNQIPRRGGRFYWRQVYNAIDAGCTMIYGAMFDEVDEGTAFYQMAPTAADLPVAGSFLSLDADGERLPADWYLRLAGEATRMLRHEIPLSPERPLEP